MKRYNIHCNVVKNLINTLEFLRKYMQNFVKSENILDSRTIMSKGRELVKEKIKISFYNHKFGKI